MLSKRIEKELNDQINAEYWSAYFYLSMAAYFENKNLPGFANWMKVQYQEEILHVMKFFNYVNDRGCRVLLNPIDSVKTEWNKEIVLFKDEEMPLKITKRVNNIEGEIQGD